MFLKVLNEKFQLNNLINFYDVKQLIKKITRGQFLDIFSKLARTKIKRVRDTFKPNTQKPPVWWIIPEVSRRINYLRTGDENLNYRKYITGKYFADKKALTCLSLGCGNGMRELNWAQLCDFKKMEAYDISESHIEFARQQASEKGCSGIIDFQVADIDSMELQENHYDVVFVEQSLHHFKSLEKLLSKISNSLKQDGYFIVNEFVGPSRLQWTDRQLEILNAILSILPEKYKVNARDGVINKKIIKPSRLRMILVGDPSEAVESSKIMPLLNKMFHIVETRPYQGAILHPLFNGIAPNFLSKDEQTQRYLHLCLEIEDLSAKTGEIQSDFVLAVCRKKSEN